ncbi:MAG: hypothetical protein BGP04_21945 [Rhizobiales bacterium 62-17]|nr:MAG: hypothetical protein BGP04_21945 [Rhizobiales bacterium 62-17]
MDPLAGVRARGRIDLSVQNRNGTTRRERVREEGAFRIRFPRERLNRLDGILVNVAGGVTGGDHYQVEVMAGAGTRTALSTVAAEKIYRSAADIARIDVSLRLDEDAQLFWLPQETIIFDRARLARRIDVEMAATARLTFCEATYLGRTAMGESVREIDWREAWTLRRGGRRIFAERLRLHGDATQALSSKATGADLRAMATLIHVAPDAEDLCEPLRERLAGHSIDRCEAAVSSFDGMLIVRMIARHGHDLRPCLVDCLSVFPGADLPRAWQT